MAAAVLALSPTGAFADDIWTGTYVREGGILTIENGRASVDVGGQGCMGQLEGTLGQNAEGKWFLLGSMQPQCVLSIEQDDPSSVRVRQFENCSFYHGASCQFEAEYRREN